jgi:RHS repeat-associated protein
MKVSLGRGAVAPPTAMPRTRRSGGLSAALPRVVWDVIMAVIPPLVAAGAVPAPHLCCELLSTDRHLAVLAGSVKSVRLPRIRARGRNSRGPASQVGTAHRPWPSFAGGYADPTELIYLVNRYYNPATGQFTSVDPLASAFAWIGRRLRS